MSAAAATGWRRRWLPSIGAALALPAGLIAAGAAVPPARTPPAAQCVLSERLVEDLSTAALLHARGLERRDPLILTAAARLRMPVEAACGGLPGIGSDTMLAEAETLADGNDPTAAIVAQTRALQPRGSTAGLSAQAALVAPHAAYRLQRRFRPRESAIVYAEGAPGTAIGLTIDGAAGLLCEGRGPPAQQLCRFVPDRPETADIVVTNHGERATRVLLVTN